LAKFHPEHINNAKEFIMFLARKAQEKENNALGEIKYMN